MGLVLEGHWRGIGGAPPGDLAITPGKKIKEINNHKALIFDPDPC